MTAMISDEALQDQDWASRRARPNGGFRSKADEHLVRTKHLLQIFKQTFESNDNGSNRARRLLG